jgi:hypothetical protein
LVKDQDGLSQRGITELQLLEQIGDLSILAPETQDRCPGDIRVMNIAGEQAAKSARIIASAAAAALVQQELDAVNVWKNPSG